MNRPCLAPRYLGSGASPCPVSLRAITVDIDGCSGPLRDLRPSAVEIHTIGAVVFVPNAEMPGANGSFGFNLDSPTSARSSRSGSAQARSWPVGDDELALFSLGPARKLGHLV
jgi:hypothetical protein